MPQRLRSRTRPTRPHSPRSSLACTPDAETLAARAHSRPPWRGRGARTHHARASGRRLAARAAQAALRIVLTRAAEDVFTPTAAESAWRQRRVDSVARAQPRRAPPSSTRARWPRRRAAPELCGVAREARARGRAILESAARTQLAEDDAACEREAAAEARSATASATTPRSSKPRTRGRRGGRCGRAPRTADAAAVRGPPWYPGRRWRRGTARRASPRRSPGSVSLCSTSAGPQDGRLSMRVWCGTGPSVK